MYSCVDTIWVDRDEIEYYHAAVIVMALSDGLLDNAHCFYIHNWYKFIEICDILKTRSTDVVSTLRCKRKGLLDGVTKKKLRTDEQIVMYEHYLAFAVTHWKDKRDVFMLATCMRE